MHLFAGRSGSRKMLIGLGGGAPGLTGLAIGLYMEHTLSVI